MPLVNKAVDAVTIIDYATVGSFILMGALFWKNNKRAAVAAWCCGAMEATNTLLTDFPGGVTDVISFETHGKIDAAMAGTVASLPNLLGFSGEPEARHFRLQGAMIGAVTGFTNFKGEEQYQSDYEVA